MPRHLVIGPPHDDPGGGTAPTAPALPDLGIQNDDLVEGPALPADTRQKVRPCANQGNMSQGHQADAPAAVAAEVAVGFAAASQSGFARSNLNEEDGCLGFQQDPGH